MKKDQVTTNEEISAEDLEKVSGGAIRIDMPLIRPPGAIPPSTIDDPQRIKGLEPDPWEKPV